MLSEAWPVVVAASSSALGLYLVGVPMFSNGNMFVRYKVDSELRGQS